MLKAFKILHIIVDIQLIELIEKPAHAKYWVYTGEEKGHANDSIGAYW